ncbi:MAG: hypothetical protein IKX88_03590, partial [Thermoguttaceae bacterium]|nr:hypothetical protein [Thermoguttaceae bacterium]
VEAKKTLLIDAEETIDYADAHNIAIVALIEEDIDNLVAENEFALSGDKRVAVGVASGIAAE